MSNARFTSGMPIIAICGCITAAHAATAPPPDTAVSFEAVSGVIDPVPGSPLDELLADWGEGSAYDLNCDGTVGTEDYLLLLADDSADAQDYLAIITEWGQGSPYDLDCDGTVGVQDMLALLSEAAESAAQSAMEETIAALLAEWGEGSPYDFDCNGIVNVEDFLVLMGNNPTTQEFLGFLADWGQGSIHDLNCDGTVDLQDYLIALADFAAAIE